MLHSHHKTNLTKRKIPTNERITFHNFNNNIYFRSIKYFWKSILLKLYYTYYV